MGSTPAEPPVLREGEDGVSLKWLTLGAVAVVVGLIVRQAWMADDAYITLRSIDNWVNGFGLRWNVDERVQGFTHPLWMLVLAVGYFITREGFLTSIFVSVLTTGFALLVLLRCARSAGHGFAALTLLACSRSFVEFSTSGLENPLTHLLVAVFVLAYACREASLFELWLSVSLLSLSRSDATLVCLPALLHATWLAYRAQGLRSTSRAVGKGLLPALAWHGFSLLYFGFPFPNTASAKLRTGVPSLQLMLQGLVYLANNLAWDAVLLVAVLVAVAVWPLRARIRERLLSLGILLYLAYVISIGGDFMLGRFLSLPLFLSACLVALLPLPLERTGALAMLAAPWGLLFLLPTATEKYPVGEYRRTGIADERAFYRDTSALMMLTRTFELPSNLGRTEGKAAAAGDERFIIQDKIGFFGYFAGPKVHIVDPNALTEPLLARLPARHNSAWRVGHYLRVLPAGYIETLKAETCKMADASLCEYYDKLHLIVAGPLWSPARLLAIAGMNLGVYDKLIDVERYRFPAPDHGTLRDLSQPVPNGATDAAPGTRAFGEDGLVIALEHEKHPLALDLSLDGNDTYEVVFRDLEHDIGTVRMESLEVPGLYSHHLETPRAVMERGFDAIWIRPLSGDGHYVAGALSLQSELGTAIKSLAPGNGQR